MTQSVEGAAGRILPLYMNGLSGRMIKIRPPSGKRREILLISGQHTNAERIFGLAEYLSRYGGVTSPDLPGFGGMDSFYKINEKPTLDSMADYLAAFVKLRYKKNQRFTIIALSYGFAVTTRMLQKYPAIAKRVDLLVSISGVTNKSDFKWKRRNIMFMSGLARILSWRLPAFVAKNVVIRAPLIKGLYRLAEKKHPKLKDVGESERQRRIDFEIELWKINDFRTWTATSVTMFKLDLNGQHAESAVYHVSIDDDHYFDQLRVEENMRQIFSDFTLIKSHLPAHAPTVLATPKDVAPFVPPKIRALLRKDP